MDPEILRELNESLRELQESLSKQSSAFTDYANSLNSAKTATNNNTTATNESTKSNNSAVAGVTKYGQTVAQVDAQLQKSGAEFVKGLQYGREGLKSFGSALVSAETSLTKYGSGANQLGAAALSVGRSIGGVATVLGGLLAGLGLAANSILTLDQNIIDFRDGFAKQAGVLPVTATELGNLARQAGFAYSRMPALAKAVNNLGPSLLSLGNYAGEGAVRFMRIADVGEDVRRRFSRMGLQQEDLLQYQAQYIELQRASGQSLVNRRKTDQQIQRESLAYAENLLTLSALTGEKAETIADRQRAAVETVQEQAMIARENEQIRQLELQDTDEARAEIDRIQTQRERRQALMQREAAVRGVQAGRDVGAMARTGGYGAPGTSGYAVGDTLNIINRQLQTGNVEQVSQDLRQRQLDALGTIGIAGEYDTELFRRFGVTETGEELNRMINIGSPEAARAAQAAAGQEGRDTLAETSASIQELEIVANQKFQEFLETIDPLRHGIETLGAAALAVTGLLAGGALIGKAAQFIFGRAGNLGSPGNPMYAKIVPGPASSAGGILSRLFGRTAAPAAAAAGVGTTASAAGPLARAGTGAAALSGAAGSAGGSRIGIFLMGLARGLSAIGKVAPQFLIGAGAISAAIAIIGAGIAGATWIMGKSLPSLATGLKSFDKVDGDNLKKVGTGMAGLGAGILAMGATGIVDAMSNIISWLPGGSDEDPVEELGKQIVKFQQFDVDPTRVENNSRAFVAFSKMLAETAVLEGLSTVTRAISGAIAGFFNVELPLERFKTFSELDIDDEQVGKNANAFKLFSEAMSSYRGYGSMSALSVISSELGKTVVEWFKAIPTENPLERFENFSKLDINSDKVRTNANAFKNFANALSEYRAAPGAVEALSQLAGGWLMSLFGADGPIEAFRKFSNENFGPNMERNAEAFSRYASASAGAGGAPAGGGGGGGAATEAAGGSTTPSASSAGGSPPTTAGSGPLSRGLAAMREAAGSAGYTTSPEASSGPAPSIGTGSENIIGYAETLGPSERAEFYRSLANQGMQKAAEARASGNTEQATLWERAANSYTMAASLADSLVQTSGGGMWQTSGSGYTYPVPGGTDTSQYGFRTHPIYGDRRFHTGLDIGKGRGAPIIAANDGRIIKTLNNARPYTGFGQVAIQDHGDGLQSVYAHLDSFSVREGEFVNRGRQIGEMGSTGASTGPHLHYILQRSGGLAAPNRSNTVDPKTKISNRPLERAEKGGVFAGFPSVFSEGMPAAEKLGALNPQSLIAKLGKITTQEVNALSVDTPDDQEIDLTPDLVSLLESKLEQVLIALENNHETHGKILKNAT